MKQNRLYANKPRLKFHYQNLFARFTTKQLIKKHIAGLQVIDIFFASRSRCSSPEFHFHELKNYKLNRKLFQSHSKINYVEKNSLAAIG